MNLEIQPEVILKTYWGFAGSAALSVALDLDLFTAIHQRHNSVEKISRHLKLPLRSTRVLMDALVGLGLLSKSKLAYLLTPESKTYLVKSEPHYLGNIFHRMNENFKHWPHLNEVVRSGKHINGVDYSTKVQFYSQLARDIFPTSYASSIQTAKKLGIGKSLKSLKMLDVACGSGAWGIAFALADKTLKVTAQDYPEVLEVTNQYIKRFRLDSQYNFLSGDLQNIDFAKQHYDIICLGHICHCLGENDARKLIKKSFEALRPGGRLLIGEFVPNDLKTADTVSLLFALQMLLDTPSGDVFSLKEFKRWLALTGFKKVSALKVLYPASVVVAVK